MVLTAEQFGSVCKSELWGRIDGWEVVAAVVFIVTAWTAVQVSRMYFMAVVARIGNDPPPKDDD